MPVLCVTVKNKTATYISRGGGVVCGNADYFVRFTFDEEWAAYPNKVARFVFAGKFIDQDFEGDTCPVPALRGVDSVQIGLHIEGDDLRTTTPATVPCFLSILDMAGVPGPENDERYARIAQQAAAEAKAAAAAAEASLGGLEARMTAAEAQIADLRYTAISISSFSHNLGTVEVGTKVTAVKLSWSFNKTPEAVTLDGVAQAAGSTGANLTGLSIKSTAPGTAKTWTLKATDERGAVATKTAALSAYNGVYYGVAVLPGAYDSGFILGLTKTLRNSKLPSFSVTAGAGQYIYYCLPKRLGPCTFVFGGFVGGIDLVSTISFTNASGYTEDYYIYRSAQPNLGATTWEVK